MNFKFWKSSGLAFMLIPLTFLSSCYHIYYVPNSSNIPLFRQKGEIRVSAAYTTAVPLTQGVELQGAYAFASHFAAIANFHTLGNQFLVSEDHGKGTNFELGGGYYLPLPANENFVLEAYGGLGKDWISNSYLPREASRLQTTRYFIQPSFGYSLRARTFSAAISSRFTFVRFNVESSSVTAENNSINADAIAKLRQHRGRLFWEPCLVVRSGLPSVQFQAIFTLPKPFRKDNIQFFEPLLLSLGIIVQLGQDLPSSFLRNRRKFPIGF